MIAKLAKVLSLVSLTGLLLMGFQAKNLAAEQTTSPPAQGGAAQPASEEAKQSVPAAPAQPPREEVIMAKVGDRKITVDEFMKYITQDTQMVVKATTDSGRAEILRELILDRLIEQGMRREGLLPSDRPPQQQDYLRAYSTLAARRFPQANAEPDEEKAHQYYLDHQQFFGIPAMVRIGQIQFRVPENASGEERHAVKARAEDTLKRLRAGEPFAELAKALTENPKGKVTEGDLGFLPLKQDPWLDKAVAGLTLGQYSEVLESPVGYEIILLKDKRDALIAPYANVREAVLARMRQEAHQKAREAYAWQLAKEVGVTVEMPELKGAIP
jgi:parvulin-like peptidyl-prolyl isomerase